MSQNKSNGRVITISSNFFHEISVFSEMRLNNLNSFFLKGIFVGLDENQNLTNIDVQKKTEHPHIYLCAYGEEKIQAFFALLIFKNEETEECWLEFSYSSECLKLIPWVKKTLEEREIFESEKAA